MAERKPFWERVAACKHERLSDHCWYWACSNEYCGVGESHCLDCGAYLIECQCGAENGMSGWPRARRRAQERNRRKP